jgi:hypothetical protein
MFTRQDDIKTIIKKILIFVPIFILTMNIFEFGLEISKYTYKIISITQLILSLVFIYIFSLFLVPRMSKNKKHNKKTA